MNDNSRKKIPGAVSSVPTQALCLNLLIGWDLSLVELASFHWLSIWVFFRFLTQSNNILF